MTEDEERVRAGRDGGAGGGDGGGEGRGGMSGPGGTSGPAGTTGPGGEPREPREPGEPGDGAAGAGGPEESGGPVPGGAVPRLTRNRRPKVVAGVCAGLGRHFGLDPVVFRVPLAVLSVVGGLGLVFYGAAWMLIPAEGESQNEARRLLSGRVEGTTLSAVIVALVGCGLFLASLGSRSTPASLLLVGAVAGAAYWARQRREAEAAEAVGAPVDPATAHAVADAPPEAKAPPVPASPSWWREPLTKDGAGGGRSAGVRDTGYLWGPEDGEPPVGAREFAPGTGAGAAVGVPPGGRRRGRTYGGLAGLLAPVAAVAGAGVGWESRPVGTSLTVGLACALTVYALGFAAGALFGRPGYGTLLLAVCTAVLLTAASLLPRDIGTDWRNVAWKPPSAAEVAKVYRLDGGRAELDLRDVEFTGERKTVRTRIRAGAGVVKVVVPSTVRIDLAARVGAGEIRLPGEPAGDGDHVLVRSIAGFDRDDRLTLPPYGNSGGAGSGKGGDERKESGKGGTLRLSTDMTAGQLEIVRLLPSGLRTDYIPADVLPWDRGGVWHDGGRG